MLLPAPAVAWTYTPSPRLPRAPTPVLSVPIYYPGLKVAHSCHESSSFRPPEVAVMAILLPDARELSDDVLEAAPVACLMRGCELEPHRSPSRWPPRCRPRDRLSLVGRLRRPRRARFATAPLRAPAGFGPHALSDAPRPNTSSNSYAPSSARRIGHRGAAVDPPCRPRPDPQGIRSRSGGADRRPVSEALGLHGQAAVQPSRP